MRSSLLLLILATLTSATASQAEVPLLRPAELQEQATHIVTDTVQHIYTTEKALDKKYVGTLFAVKVAVTRVDQGIGSAPQPMIFAKAWRMKERERGWVGPSGLGCNSPAGPSLQAVPDRRQRQR